MSPARWRTQETAAVLSEVLTDAFRWCEELAERLLDVHSAAGELSTEELSGLWQPIFDRLAAEPGLFAGTGVILAEGVLSNRAHWLEWWQNTPDGTPKFLQVDHDPSSVGFYDYAAAPWFTAPRDDGEAVAVGPYVDYAGTDDYMLTLAVPVRATTGFLGVAAADLHAGAFERVLLRHFGPADPPVALLNSSNRVIMSNTPHRLPGQLVPAAERGGATACSAVDTPGTAAGLPWHLAVLADRTRPSS